MTIVLLLVGIAIGFIVAPTIAIFLTPAADDVMQRIEDATPFPDRSGWDQS